MNVWFEICKQHHGDMLSWQLLFELVREARCYGDANVMQMEIDLAYGLKDGHASKIHSFYSVILYYINVTTCVLSFSNTFQVI
jgi:hypothetical protein